MRRFATVFGIKVLSYSKKVWKNPSALYFTGSGLGPVSIYRLESVFYPTNFLQAGFGLETLNIAWSYSAYYKFQRH